MTKRFTYILLLAIFGCALFSCSDDEPVPNATRLGFQFFPLQVGQSSVYQVEEINYLITGVDTSIFELKVDVVDSFISQSGELNYVLHRFRKNEGEDSFDFQETWSARVNSTTAVEIEGSTPFIKLSFPIEAGRIWDGNALNTLEEDRYEMDSLFVPYITNRMDTIDNALTVIQADNQDFIVALDRRIEVYGEGVGLVYREDVRLNYCTDEDCIGQQIVDSGREFRQTLISHVKN